MKTGFVKPFATLRLGERPAADTSTLGGLTMTTDRIEGSNEQLESDRLWDRWLAACSRNDSPAARELMAEWGRVNNWGW